MVISTAHKPSAAADTRGFTLIEAVLAIGISAVVVAAIGGIFYSALRLRDRSVAMLDEGSQLQPVLTILKRDLSGAMPPEGFLASGFLCGDLDGILMRGVGVQFITTSGTGTSSGGGADLQQVTYVLRDSTGGRRGAKDLIRAVTSNLLGTTLEPPEEELLLSGVELFQVDCFDGNQWRPDWDTSLTDTNLPMAVRVQIQVASANQNERSSARSAAPLELIVPLTIQSRTNLQETISAQQEDDGEETP
jgi:type II secretory pathway component PulJ